jgi:predicted Zn-dependent protease with MMP-like domain
VAYHVSREEFNGYLKQAIAALPEQFARVLGEMPIEVRDRPTRKQLRSVGLDDDELLLGLYTGIAITERSVEHSGQMPDKVYLFQEDIELVSDSREQLVDEIRITLLHEIGHHFGLDEDELDELGYR